LKSVIFYQKEKSSPLKFVKGYVNIFVEGVFLERFINICRSKNIILWNIERKRSTIMYVNISIEDFRKIKRIASKTKCRIKIKSKKGLPFIFYRYKKRKIFLICLILVFLGLLAFSQFLWNVDVVIKDSVGSKQMNSEQVSDKEASLGQESFEQYNIDEIRFDLEEAGLKTGVLKNKINVNTVINNIRLKRDDIAWMGINLKGTNAIVEIVFSTEKPNIVDESDFCNIVADKEGIIHKISAQNGTISVNKGDLVRKGDVLIAGWIEGKYTGKEAVHSRGDVQAKVWYSKKEKQEYKQYIKQETGAVEEKFAIKFNNFQINLYKVLTNFKKCDKIVENKKLEIFSDFYLPIEVIKITNKECEVYEKVYSEEELQNQILTKLENELLEEIKAKNQVDDVNSIITNKQVIVNKDIESLEVELVYEVLENIGVEVKLSSEELQDIENSKIIKEE